MVISKENCILRTHLAAFISTAAVLLTLRVCITDLTLDVTVGIIVGILVPVSPRPGALGCCLGGSLVRRALGIDSCRRPMEGMAGAEEKLMMQPQPTA